jgi:hypothetical protein
LQTYVPIVVDPDALSRYIESPEKSRDESLKIGYANKQRDAEEAMDALLKKSEAIRNVIESRNHPSDAVVVPSAVGRISDRFSGKKQKLGEGNKSHSQMQSGVIQKTNYIDRRTAKFFLVEEEGSQVMKLFFGTVTEYRKEQSWWHVEYDDGDDEDMSTEELLPCLKLYNKNKSKDPKK